MLILASASSARRNLLKQVDIHHTVIISGVDEENFHQSEPKQLVKALSLAKAQAVAKRLLKNKIDVPDYSQINAVLGCDSIFEFEGEVFGKPKSKKDAILRWTRMSAKTGQLHTGHCLLLRKESSKDIGYLEFNNPIQKVISTQISFSKLSKSEIEEYVATGEPLECAGGFALEGKASIFIEKINGCYSNIIGLSLPWLRSVLSSSWENTRN